MFGMWQSEGGRKDKETNIKWESIAIISCNDLDDTRLIVYHTGANCNLNYVPFYYLYWTSWVCIMYIWTVMRSRMGVMSSNSLLCVDLQADSVMSI